MRIAPGGLLVAAVPALIGLATGAIVAWPAAVVGLALAVACLAFYRDPARSPAGAGLVAPADGRVHAVDERDGRVTIAIFLNVHNVHVVRAPDDGLVTGRERVSGHRRPAFLGRAAENAGVEIDTDNWTVTLRAGLIARRVRPYVAVGDAIDRGDRLGHIAFGSRVDLICPPAVEPEDLTVEVGDRVRAGETVLAANGQ